MANFGKWEWGWDKAEIVQFAEIEIAWGMSSLKISSLQYEAIYVPK